MDIDVDQSSDSDTSAIETALVAPDSGIDALGGSVSRSARLRATTTDDEDEGEDDEDEDEDEEDNHNHDHSDASASASISRHLKPAAHRSFVTAARGERYLVQTSKPAKTSASKLSDVLLSPCTQKDLVRLLVRQSSSPKGKATERQLRVLEEAYMSLFSQWKAELGAHFKLLFYGLGSKIRLLNLFTQRSLRAAVTDQRVVLLDGFKADMSVLDLVTVLESILVPEKDLVDDPLYSARSAARIDERVVAILQKLNSAAPHISPTKPIYLLVHSIDGPDMRSPRSQATVWTLASHPCVRLIASFDHTKAPLLFPASNSSGSGAAESTSRSIIYHHTPTLRPYTVESLASGCMSFLYPPTIFLSDLHLLQTKQGGMRGASSASRAKAAAFVLASLTQKAKDLFQMIAMRQISNSEPGQRDLSHGTPPFAAPYPSFFAAARDAFLANNVGQMEALLREFRDHEIVLSSSVAPAYAEGELNQEQYADVGQRSSEWLWVNIDADDLQGLLDKIQL